VLYTQYFIGVFIMRLQRRKISAANSTGTGMTPASQLLYQLQ